MPVYCPLILPSIHWVPGPLHVQCVTPNPQRVRQRTTDLRLWNRVETHCNHSDMWNYQYEHTYSPPICFAFHMCDTHFWCAVKFLGVSLDAFGVNLEVRVAPYVTQCIVIFSH